MEAIKKNFMFILGLIVLVGAVYYFSSQPKPESNRNENLSNQTASEPAEAVLAEVFSYQGEEGKSALELLKAKAEVTESQPGFVESINGRKADSGKREFWGFYVNGHPSEVGAGSYQTKAADVIEWKITTY